MNMASFKYMGIGVFIAVGIAAAATAVEANHSWNGYHWARTANPFTLKLGDNVSSAWDGYLATSSIDWSASSVLDTAIAAGQKDPRRCKPTAGRVEVCSAKYGKNGWLGVAQIWASGNHITQGTVKVNDTYFTTAQYNKPAWKNLVMCQEIGHTLGLDHQDEIFDNPNLGTCMDYTGDPDGTRYAQLGNEHPNAHDYEELEVIYAHLDSFTTLGQAIAKGKANGAFAPADLSDPQEWGAEVRKSPDNRNSLFERDLGGNEKLFTFVIWAR